MAPTPLAKNAAGKREVARASREYLSVVIRLTPPSFAYHSITLKFVSCTLWGIPFKLGCVLGKDVCDVFRATETWPAHVSISAWLPQRTQR